MDLVVPSTGGLQPSLPSLQLRHCCNYHYSLYVHICLCMRVFPSVLVSGVGVSTLRRPHQVPQAFSWTPLSGFLSEPQPDSQGCIITDTDTLQ